MSQERVPGVGVVFRFARPFGTRVGAPDEDGIFFGGIAAIRYGVGFHADTVEGLRAAFHKAVEDYLEACARLGRER